MLTKFQFFYISFQRESNTYYFFSIITDNVNIICIRKEKYTSGIIVILNILLINYLQGSVYVRANPNKDIPKGCVSRSIWQSQQEKQQDSSKLRSPIKVPVGLSLLLLL